MEVKWLLVVVTSCFHSALGQTNTGNNVAYSLLNCYNNTALPGVTVADERPPATLNILIEYIRKLEDANPTMSTRQLSYHILQTLRQDGIARTERSVDEKFGVPFSSSRPERYKFRVILQNLLPDAEQSLNNGDLTEFERCSLHYMISNTIDDLRRENEAMECLRSSRYTSRILSRFRKDVRKDIENTELINQEPGLGASATNLARNNSQCPIEMGVVYSQFGTIKAGNVLAGIATSLNQQNVRGGLVDNRYAATITGEICEAALYQATADVSLGAPGGWNSTINPKYFFLQNNNLLQATDAELRGALDGLYIALRMNSLTSRFPDIKISQILDMYYSTHGKGLFDSSFKACNRNILYYEMTSSNIMRSQLLNFMPVLNSAAISGVSLTNVSFGIFSNSGVTAFEKYLPQLASEDLACLSVSSIQTVVADLLIFIDSSWPFRTVQLVLSYILNNIDVNKFQTRYTLFGGSSLRNLTSNGTRYLSDFYIQYNQTVHENETTGFDYVRIFEALESYGYEKLNNKSYTAGESTIILLLPRTSLTEDQRTFLSQRKGVFDSLLPDMNFLVLGSGSASDYDAIVSNPNRDVVILQETSSEETLKTLGQQIVNSIKEVPRAIVNPSCTAQYTGTATTFSLIGYVEPLGINYYRISPNYFYTGGESRNLRITEKGYGTIYVCISRDNSKLDNSTNNCRSLSSADYNIEITNYCEGNSLTSCLPIYISVSGGNSSIKCNSNLCRFPDDIHYSITIENVGCASGSIVASASAILVVLLCVFSRYS